MIDSYKIRLGENPVDIKIIHSSRKTLALEVKGGIVKARVPMRVSDKNVISFIEKNKNWIERAIGVWKKKVEENKASGLIIPPLCELTSNEHKTIKKSLERRVEYFAGLLGVSYNRKSIRDQRTRWGSCSSKGNLNFNYRLFFLKSELMDYVVIHELSHRIHMNHSREFWNVVEEFCPNYRDYRKQLSEIQI